MRTRKFLLFVALLCCVCFSACSEEAKACFETYNVCREQCDYEESKIAQERLQECVDNCPSGDFTCAVNCAAQLKVECDNCVDAYHDCLGIEN